MSRYTIQVPFDMDISELKNDLLLDTGLLSAEQIYWLVDVLGQMEQTM